MEKIASLIGGLLEGLDLKRKWLAAVCLVLVIILGLLTFECATGHFYYASLEKKVRLLKEMQLIAKDGVASNLELYPLYLDTIGELTGREISPLRLPKVNDPVTVGKALGGSSIWIALALAGLFGAFGKDNSILSAVLISLFAILIGYVGTLIPTFITPWINYIGFPFAQLILLYILGSRAKKKP